ncbi:MAG: SDR family oxidoreductase [Candidatus Lokiarchaeota archaeon]|nr:SDR family oxidoreductase [Candidatus Harpocratesius repetitus]
MKWNFENKIAIITGGASGIGKQIAKDMVESGASVAIFDLDATQGEKTLQELQGLTENKVRFFQGSVADKEFVDSAVSEVFKEMGEVDFLINCAGILRDFMIHRFDEKKWDLTLEVNLKGVAVVSQAVVTQWISISKAKAAEKGEKYLPVLENPPRVIVNIASMAADGNMGQMAYSASKAGVVGMTLTMAKELNRYNIRAHALKPTLIETPIIGDLLQKNDGKFRNMYESKIPFGIGKTKYVSDPVCFLCSEGGYFMNGCIIPINGGKLDGL